MIALECRLLLLPAVLSVAHGWFEPRPYNGTTTWSSLRHIDATPPLVLEAGGRLVHVLDATDANRALRFEAANLTACRPSLRLAYAARYPRRAVSLANGKLVVWLSNYRLTAGRHVAEWRFQIVEPGDCSSADFKIRDADPLPIDVVDVVGYADSFDVFLVGLAEEEPRSLYVYRYGDDGKPASSAVVSVIPDIDPGPFYRPNSIRVHTVSKNDPSQGYFYVHSRPDLNTTTIKRLDAKFSPEKIIVLHHQTPLIYSTTQTSLTACHFELDEPRLQCSFYDEWLNKSTSTTLDYSQYRILSRGLRVYADLENLPGGGALLFRAIYIGNRRSIVVGQRLFADGSASQVLVFGEVHCQIYWLRAFQMSDDCLHCIAVSCDETVHTRCGCVR